MVPLAKVWMQLESIMLSEISQAVRDKYHMMSGLFFNQYNIGNIGKNYLSVMVTIE